MPWLFSQLPTHIPFSTILVSSLSEGNLLAMPTEVTCITAVVIGGTYFVKRPRFLERHLGRLNVNSVLDVNDVTYRV